MKVAFVCVNVGDRYPMQYVEVLRDMVLRNFTRSEHECAWFCVTDRPDEVPAGVYPLESDPDLPGYWQKINLFSPRMPWEPGTRIAYFDLDVCITGPLEDFVERKGIARDAGWPCFNSSVMIWDAGDHADVWERFTPDVMWRAPGPIVPANLLPAGVPNGGDQEFLTEVGGWDELPAAWVQSYKWQAKEWPPTDCRVVQFHGLPKPADVTDGWVPDVWRVGGLTAFPEFKGANTSEEYRLANVEAACKRDLPWFTGFRDEGLSCVIVGGAPSLNDTIADIRWRARQKRTRIVAVNNVWRKLIEHGVKVDRVVICDARPENAEFVKDAPAGMRFLLASQCHPDVFDAVPDHCEVALWHCGWGDGGALWSILKPYEDQKPIIIVPGGSTVTLRTMWLAVFSGFRALHLYGCDGCYRGDEHHAYPQALNDGETVLEVVRGSQRYRVSAWQGRQAGDFEQTWKDLTGWRDFEGNPAPVTIHVHGQGLLPDIARSLRERGRAA